MTNTVDASLRRLATVAGSFFAGLSLLVSSFPHLNEISGAFPYTPRPEGSIKWLASIVTLAVVGGGYLSARVSASTRRRPGTRWLFVAVITLLLYIFVGLEEGASGFEPRFTKSNGVLAAVYLSVYAMLGRGFFEMSLFAYGVRSGSLPTTEGLPTPLWKSLARWWQKHRTKRAHSREQSLQAKVRSLSRRMEKAEEDRRRREAKERAVLERLQRQMRRRVFLLQLIIAAVIVLVIFLVAPMIVEVLERM